VCLRTALPVFLPTHEAAQPPVDEQEWRRRLEVVEGNELIVHDEVAAMAAIADQQSLSLYLRELASVAFFQASSFGNWCQEARVRRPAGSAGSRTPLA
jgi:hypothetical protein